MNKKYKAYRNEITANIKKRKTEYFALKISNTPFNSKELWKTLNKAVNGKKKRDSKDPKSLMVEGKVTENMQEIVETFNQHYTNITDTIKHEIDIIRKERGETEAKVRPISNERAKENKVWEEFNPVTEYSTKKIINSLKLYAAAGMDQIPAKIIKENRDKLVKPITHMINTSISSGTFPEMYKKAVIRPIYKGGNVEDINNYRPVSLLSNVSKIIEKAVKEQLVSYLEEEKFFVESQLGFRRNKGTEDAINRLNNTLINHLDKGKKCLAVFQDLSKAFDLVEHEKLLKRIEEAGCRGKVLMWFQSYLNCRKQKVKIGETASKELQLRVGTPQGSALSPILFLIYMNELGRLEIKGEIISYADDTALIEEGNNWVEVKQNTEEDLGKIITWLNNNNFILNLRKTSLIQFGLKNKKNEEDVKIFVHHTKCKEKRHVEEGDCQVVMKAKHARYLGVTIDKNLNWKEHIKTVSGKLLKTIYLALQVKNMLPKRTKRLIYKAMIQSKIQYGISAWGATYKTNLRPVIRSQKKFLKILYNKPKIYSTKMLFKKTGVPTIEELHEISTIKYVKKAGKLNNVQEKSKRTRNNELTITLPTVKTNAGKRTSMYKGLQYFNKLNIEDKEEIIKANSRKHKKTIRNLLGKNRRN